MKTCSFFGHRDAPQTDELKEKVRETVERLIVEEGVDTFLFGSRSKFDELCHIVVTELKEKYSHIRRVVYLCKHETISETGCRPLLYPWGYKPQVLCISQSSLDGVLYKVSV